MIAYYDFYDNEGRHTGSYISDDTLEETMKDLHLVTIEYNGVVYDRINMEQGRGGWKVRGSTHWAEKVLIVFAGWFWKFCL